MTKLIEDKKAVYLQAPAHLVCSLHVHSPPSSAVSLQPTMFQHICSLYSKLYLLTIFLSYQNNEIVYCLMTLYDINPATGERTA